MSARSPRKTIAALVAATLVGGLLGRTTTPEPSARLTFDPSKTYEVTETQDLAYKGVRASRDTWGRPVTLPAIADEARYRMAPYKGQGFQVKPRARDWWSESESLNDALLRFTSHLRGSEVGVPWYIRPIADDTKRFKGIKVDLNPAVILNTPGTEAIDILIGTTVSKFPRVKSFGLCAVKKISGSNSYSQHSFANAIDLGGPGAWGSPGYVAYLDKVANYLTRLDAKGYIPLAQLLWRGVANHYPGHIHLTGDPLLSGPFCA